MISFIIISCIAITGCISPVNERADNLARQAGRLIERSGVTGGLIVHYECGDGKLTAALKHNERYTVHGLDRDAKDIAAARGHIASKGLKADVSVMQWGSPRLPYTDNLVNLFVAEEDTDIPEQEILRVLAPGGVALVGGKKTVKPWPGVMDEWHQTRYDHTSNGVSKDTVGTPRHLRWTAGPLHARSHEENSSTMAVVTAGGRLFYIQDEGLIGVSDGRLPSRWKLIARDAFNGRMLWKHPVPEWGWQVWEPQKREEVWTTHMAQRHQFPSGMARRLIASGDRVYVTLGYRAPVSVIDAATGEVIRTLEQTGNSDEIVLVEDILLVLQRKVPARDRSRETPESNPSRIQAIDTRSGKTLWSVTDHFIWQWSMVSDGECVFYYDADSELVHAVDLKTGGPLWQTPSTRQEIETVQYIGMTYIVHEGFLIEMGPERITAYDTGAGKVLWTMKGKKARAPVSHNQPSMFVADGLLWLGGPSGSEEGESMTGHDPGTGKEVRTIEPGYLINTGHHYRCYPPRATEHFIIFPRRGAEFMDLEGNRNLRHDWLRGACRFGYIPANGLFYVTPHQCFCYTGVLVSGFNAFASGIDERYESFTGDEVRLIEGPSYRKAMTAGEYNAATEPWPMYRHDNSRSGGSGSDIPAQLACIWEADLDGELVQPVIAQGHLFIADKSGNRIVCLEQNNGKQLWQFTADAEIDSPPTWYKGLLLFGCSDGRVYCLDADSGTLAWRYHMAPQVRLIMDESRLQSAWPVHGSVIVLNDIVYAAAGRSSFLDGGIYLAGLDVFSGKLVHEGRFEGPYPDMTRRADNGYYMEGGNNDILVTDGQFIYLRQNKFDLGLNRIFVEPITRMGDKNTGLHLFATGGMLDDTFWNRNFWMYSERWPGFYIANQAPKSGQLVIFDEQNTYAVKHYVRRNPHSPMNIPEKDGYLVFADRIGTPLNLHDGSDETKPIEWLLESNKLLHERSPTLDYPAINRDKGIGFTRRTPPLWRHWHPTRFMAMSRAGDKLVLCGTPDRMPEDDPLAAYEGRLGSRLVILDRNEGTTLGVFALDEVPVFNGISIGNGHIYMVTEEGSVLCLGKAT